MSSSFQQQLVHLNEAGFPNHVIVSIAEALLRATQSGEHGSTMTASAESGKKKISP